MVMKLSFRAALYRVSKAMPQKPTLLITPADDRRAGHDLATHTRIRRAQP